MGRLFCPLFVGVLVSVSLIAGVVYEIETKAHDASPPRTLDNTFSVEGRQLKFNGVLGSGPRSTMIYQGDRREMVVDHDRKSYIVVNEQALQKVGDQLNQASRQIQEQLKNLPENQRAMVEKMMKGRLPQTPERPRSKCVRPGRTPPRTVILAFDMRCFATAEKPRTFGSRTGVIFPGATRFAGSSKTWRTFIVSYCPTANSGVPCPRIPSLGARSWKVSRS